MHGPGAETTYWCLQTETHREMYTPVHRGKGRDRGGLGLAWASETSKFTPQWHTTSHRPHCWILLIFLSSATSWYSNIWAYRGHSFSNHHTMVRNTCDKSSQTLIWDRCGTCEKFSVFRRWKQVNFFSCQWDPVMERDMDTDINRHRHGQTQTDRDTLTVILRKVNVVVQRTVF